MTTLPRFLGSNRIKRELSILIILAGLYFMPAREEGYLFVHSLDLAHTRDNLAALYRALAQNGRDLSHQSLFERRLGYTPDLDARCCIGQNTPTYRELKSITEEVRRVSGDRSVYLESIPWDPSMIYFLSDLKVGTSMPGPTISRWTRDDVDRLRDELTRNPPSCVVTTDPLRKVARMLVDNQSMTLVSRIGGLAIFCNQSKESATLSGSDE